MSLLLSAEEAQLLETDGAARGETKLAWAILSRDRGRRSQPHLKTMERSDRVVRWGIKEQILSRRGDTRR